MLAVQLYFTCMLAYLLYVQEVHGRLASPCALIA